MAEDQAPAKPATIADLKKTMTFEQLSQLERDMQLKAPEDVKLPGGGTLRDLLDRQATAHEKEKAAQVDIADTPTSSVLRDHAVTFTPEGQMIAQPLATKEEIAVAKETATSG
jgi:hypothetical protein